jgi:hypothetical protein
MPEGSINGIGTLSLAAQILLASLPLATLVLVGVLVFFWMLWDHRRRMMIIARGGNPPPLLRPDKLPLVGYVSLFIGVALMAFFGVTQRGVGQAMLMGVVPAAAGAGVLVYQRLTRGGAARDRGGA